MKYPPSIESRRRIYFVNWIKGLAQNSQKVTKYKDQHLKNARVYTGWNVVNIKYNQEQQNTEAVILSHSAMKVWK